MGIVCVFGGFVKRKYRFYGGSFENIHSVKDVTWKNSGFQSLENVWYNWNTPFLDAWIPLKSGRLLESALSVLLLWSDTLWFNGYRIPSNSSTFLSAPSWHLVPYKAHIQLISGWGPRVISMPIISQTKKKYPLILVFFFVSWYWKTLEMCVLLRTIFFMDCIMLIKRSMSLFMKFDL